MMDKIKRMWLSFLERIADQNQKAYGGGSINCCELKDANVPKN